MKKPPIIHPFLFAIFPIFFLFSHNIGQAAFSDILLPLSVSLMVTIFATASLTLFIKESRKSALVVSVFSILFFSYGHVYDIIDAWRIGSFIIGQPKYLLSLWGILFICAAWRIVSTSRNLYNLTRTLNYIGICLVGISLVGMAAGAFKINQCREVDSKSAKAEAVNVSANKTVLPSIYYIILDSYAGSDTLKEIYGYDNSPFTDYLTGKGFYIASKSHSNYPMTFLSLASSLNMEYINYLREQLGENSNYQRAAYRMIRDSKVSRFLKSRGYKYIHFRSGWGATIRNPYADMDIQYGINNEFLVELIRTTMLGPFVERYIRVDIRNRVLGIFAKLAELAGSAESLFVFAHLTVPHSPYIFGADGEPVEETTLYIGDSFRNEKKFYMDQLIFVNKKVEEVVEKILADSRVPPVIILQADHGPASTFGARWPEHPTKGMLRERMHILNAFYLPGKNSNCLYEEITPVNAFRLVFDLYFNTNYGLLNDRNFYSTEKYPYRFTEVTNKFD